MTDERLKFIYEQLQDDAFTTMDLYPYWHFTTPAILATHHITCTDNTSVSLHLVKDHDPTFDVNNIYMQITYNGWYIEHLLYNHFVNAGKWFKMMNSPEVMTIVMNALHEVINGGREFLERRIKEDGILCKASLAITANRFPDIKKLPHTCALAVNGQVFHGIKEIEEYCRIQKETSSPYILKRCHELPIVDNEDEAYEARLSRNYLICKSKSEAERCMKYFIGIRNISALSPEAIPTPFNFPPLVCYVDRSRHLILSYREGKEF